MFYVKDYFSISICDKTLRKLHVSMDEFKNKYPEEFQAFLKARICDCSHQNKPRFVELCEGAKSLNIEIDPNSLI